MHFLKHFSLLSLILCSSCLSSKVDIDPLIRQADASLHYFEKNRELICDPLFNAIFWDAKKALEELHDTHPSLETKEALLIRCQTLIDVMGRMAKRQAQGQEPSRPFHKVERFASHPSSDIGRKVIKKKKPIKNIAYTPISSRTPSPTSEKREDLFVMHSTSASRSTNATNAKTSTAKEFEHELH